MKSIKVLAFVFMVCAFAKTNAQSSSTLIGKWETTYDVEGEQMSVDYQIKDDGGKLLCHTLSLKDDQGRGEAYHSLVMTDIRFQGKKGEAQYLFKYEGETYEVKAALHLTSANTLEVSYSYYGYSDTEIWKRAD